MTTIPSDVTDPRDPRTQPDHSPEQFDHNDSDEPDSKDKEPSLVDLVTNPEEFDNWQRERIEEEDNESPDQ